MEMAVQHAAADSLLRDMARANADTPGGLGPTAMAMWLSRINDQLGAAREAQWAMERAIGLAAKADVGEALLDLMDWESGVKQATEKFAAAARVVGA